ncbi:hypothetical protein F1880_008435 [Penicillium rolfsii]|nr:hypothetical protein F1880_008435 [Penicillium rolfsii]
MSLPGEFRASVIASCSNPQPENIISQYGKSHYQDLRTPDVTKEEAENQRIAYKLVDNRIVYIPRVYAFFSDERGWCYIVIGYIEGKVIDPLEDINAIEKVAGVVDYFATFRHDIPGPLFSGTCRGLLFPETKDLVFDSLDEMEKWFNSRLFAHNPKLNF